MVIANRTTSSPLRTGAISIMRPAGAPIRTRPTMLPTERPPTQPTTRTRPPVKLTAIDNMVKNVGGATGSTGTYLGKTDAVGESFIQKNKSWLIPTGIGVGLLGVYLLTKKKK